MNYLLDTDVISQFQKKRPDARVEEWLDRTPDKHLYISAFSIAELRYGMHLLPAGKQRTALEQWIDEDLQMHFFNRVLFPSFDVLDRYAFMMAQAKRTGFTAGVLDTFIAAMASAEGMVVATLNRKDFLRLGVEIVEF